MGTLHDFTVGSAAGPVDLADQHGSVVLVVPVGRESGPTPQLAGLQRLADAFRDNGLVVLALFDPPVPGAAAPTAATLNVTVPVVGPTDEPGTAALLAWLSEQAPGPFGTVATPGYTKFLVGRDGSVIRRFAATDDPAELIAAVRLALAQPVPPRPAPAVPTAVELPPVQPAPADRPAAPAPADSAVAVAQPDPEAPTVTGVPSGHDVVEEDSLEDIAQELYEVEAEVRMVEELGREQRQVAIEAELAAALGEQQAVSQSDQPGSHVTSDPSIPDGESTPIAPDERPTPRDRQT